MNLSADFVLDSSVAMAWGFVDEANADADKILDAMPSLTTIVPAIWPFEVANTLIVGERRRRITSTGTLAFLGLLNSFSIQIEADPRAQAWGDAMQLSRVHGLSVYDASYVDLAIRRSLPLATLDAKLRAAAVALGVRLFVPT